MIPRRGGDNATTSLPKLDEHLQEGGPQCPRARAVKQQGVQRSWCRTCQKALSLTCKARETGETMELELS